MIRQRSLLTVILLNIVTFGFYGWYFWYTFANDMNTVCEGDGDHTPGFFQALLLGLVTCGIYTFYWEYKMANRLQANAPRYGMTFQENGTTVLMWTLFGSLLCSVGYWISMNIFIKNMNAIGNAYNSYVPPANGQTY